MFSRLKALLSNRPALMHLCVQFLKFCVVGVSNTLVSLGVYYLILYFSPAQYVLGNALGWAVGVLNSYFLNRLFVFRDSAVPVIRGLLRSYLLYGVSLLLSTGLLLLQVEILGIPRQVAPIINLAFTTPLNFLLNKFWAFRK